MYIEWDVTIPAFFVENSFVLRGRDPAPWADPNLHSASAADRWGVRRLYRDHCDILTTQGTPFDHNWRRRNDVAIGLHVRQLCELLIRNRQA